MLLRWVDRAGGIVEHEHPRVGEDRAGERDTLPLAAAEREATLAEEGVVAEGQAQDEVVGTGKPRGSFHIRVRCIGSRERDVRRDRVVEQKCVFEHDRDCVSQVGQREVADVDAVDGDGALVHVVEAHQQASERGLSATGGADHGDRRARRNVQIEVAKHLVVRVVPEADVAERDLADAVPGGQHDRCLCITHCGDGGQHFVHSQQRGSSALAEGDRHAEVAQREDE